MFLEIYFLAKKSLASFKVKVYFAILVKITSGIPSTSVPGSQTATNAFERLIYLFTSKGLPLKKIETTGIFRASTTFNA